MLLAHTALFGQQKDILRGATFPTPARTASFGTLKGKVKDSVYNFMLVSATIAIYKDSDSSLLQYTLPNNFGEFTVSKLPLNTTLRLIITHVGYKDFFRSIIIAGDKSELDVGLQYLYQLARDSSGNTMEEVVVKSIVPMRMNGDTLEFNADAFRLDSNATAEDLMRRLPGFTIWGDGEVTFNGKKIQQILVEGKPFMGSSDPTIATQNLPKSALDKIQVYQQRNEKNPLDSTLFANIKLKEGKKMGHFGKIGGGYGTNSRYAGDGMLSGFNNKLQFTGVGALNNINKMAPNVETLLKNSSFKGGGAGAEYQSDFALRGINKPIAAGMKFQYDFIPDVSYQNNSRLNADFYINHLQTDVQNNSLENTYLSADTTLTRSSISNSVAKNINQRLSSSYFLQTQRVTLNFNSSIYMSHDRNSGSSTILQSKTGLGETGKSITRSESEARRKGISGGMNYTFNPGHDGNVGKRKVQTFTLGYHFSLGEILGNSHNYSQQRSVLALGINKDYDRFYRQRDSRSHNHTLSFSYPGIRQLLLNRAQLGNIGIGFSGSYTVNNTTSIDLVEDKGSEGYELNQSLTNTLKVQTKNFMPSIDLSKTFYKGLTNRYNKWISIRLNLRKQFYSFESEAIQVVQGLTYQYSYFVPSASLEYSNHQFGSYEVKYGLNYRTNVSYPGILQIAPLVDSANLWYVPKGNLGISPQIRRAVSFAWGVTTRKPKNPLIVDLDLSAGATENYITDSSLYDEPGVRTAYYINENGNWFSSGGVRVKKAIEFKRQRAIELEWKYNTQLNQVPQYMNSVANISRNKGDNYSLTTGYRQGDLFNLRAEAGLSFSASTQKGFNNSRFKSVTQYGRFLGTVQLPKNLVWATNITFHKTEVNNARPFSFAIWNASITYRFLKGNRGEAKFSALDLVRQNKGFTNAVSGNTQSFTTTNVLQQYYLLSLSYFPRKFGK